MTFGGDWLFDDLNQHLISFSKDLVDLSYFINLRFVLKAFEQVAAVVVVSHHFGELQQAVDIRAKVLVMEKGIFLISHINEGCIEPVDDFSDRTQVNVSYFKLVFQSFGMELHQLLIMQQGYSTPVLSRID